MAGGGGGGEVNWTLLHVVSPKMYLLERGWIFSVNINYFHQFFRFFGISLLQTN